MGHFLELDGGWKEAQDGMRDLHTFLNSCHDQGGEHCRY
jgi:hypothetical protein